LIFRNILLFLSLAFSAFFVACGFDFEQHYDKINEDMVRPISYQFLNLDWNLWAETAPGDIVWLEVFFTGKRISLSDITWKANWNIFTDEFGRITPRGSDVNLGNIAWHIEDVMGGQMVYATFRLPEDILHNADVIPNDLTELQRIFNINFDNIEGFPSDIFTKAGGLTFLEILANSWQSQSQIPQHQRPRIDGLAQILSAMYEIYLEIPNTPRIVIRHTARWHGRLFYYDFGNGFYRFWARTNKNPETPYLEFFQGGWMIGDSYSNHNNPIRISLSRHERTGTVVAIVFPDADRFYTLEQAFSPNPQLSEESFKLRVFFSSSIHGKIEIENGGFVNMATFEGGYRYSHNIILNQNNINVGDTGWIWVVVFDERHGVANFPQGRNVVGIPVEFVP